MLIAPWWGWRSRTSHLLVELQHSIPRLRRVLLFITRQFDPGNACFTYRQINSIALTENWARNCAQFFIGRKQVGGEKCPLLLTISSLSSRGGVGGLGSKGLIRERETSWSDPYWLGNWADWWSAKIAFEKLSIKISEILLLLRLNNCFSFLAFPTEN